VFLYKVFLHQQMRRQLKVFQFRHQWVCRVVTNMEGHPLGVSQLEEHLPVRLLQEENHL
jgi:hypothetical protein